MNICDELYDYIITIKKENFYKEYINLSIEHDFQIVKFIFLEVHNFTMDDDTYKEQLIRIHQDKFRKELMELYNSSCVITKVSKFQACHIIPFSDSEATNKYSKYNGILLKADLHELFDDYVFSIEPNTYQVVFNKDFFNNKFNKEEYERFDNNILNLADNEELKKNLTAHYNIFLNNKVTL